MPWDARTRDEVLAGLARLGGLYMGEAEPEPGEVPGMPVAERVPRRSIIPGLIQT